MAMANQITGTIGDELLLGTPEPDDIRGDGDTLSGGSTNTGADTILALGGADTVFGDAQTLTQGAQGGNDAIFGDAGDDALYGDAAMFGGPAPPLRAAVPRAGRPRGATTSSSAARGTTPSGGTPPRRPSPPPSAPTRSGATAVPT